MNKGLVGLIVAAGLGAWTVAADAATVYIGVSSINVAPAPTVSAPNAVFMPNTTIGGITFSALAGSQGSAVVVPPVLLDALNFNASTVAGGDAYLWVSATGITSPIGDINFITDFTNLLLPLGWTATLETFFNQNNSIFGTTTMLTPVGGLSVPPPCGGGITCSSATASFTANNVTPTYSLTEVFHITAPVGVRGSLQVLRMLPSLRFRVRSSALDCRV